MSELFFPVCTIIRYTTDEEEWRPDFLGIAAIVVNNKRMRGVYEEFVVFVPKHNMKTSYSYADDFVYFEEVCRLK